MSKKLKKEGVVYILNKMNQTTKAISLVRYQCNYCSKLRKLIIPKNIVDIKDDTLCQYVDVHRCKDNEYAAIVCFVDNNLTVRAQSRIKATHAGYEPDRDFTAKENNTPDPFKLFNIPLPSQTNFVEKKIKNFLFFSNNIEGLTIKDRLRNCIYRIAQQDGAKAITVLSNLGFIEITLFLKENASKELYQRWKQVRKAQTDLRTFPYDNVRQWIKILADNLESVVTLDETVLSYIAEYIDRYVLEPPEEQKLLELTLLIQMTISVPYTEPDLIEKFELESKNVLNGVTIVDIRNMGDILELCLNNFSKTLRDIYNDQEGISTFSDFVKAVYLLEKHGYLKIHKLAFEDY